MVRNKWREARDLLVRNALRKPIFGTLQPLRGVEDLESDVNRLIFVLNQVARDDPRVYSLALQSFLAFMGIHWPDEVFKHDFAVPSRGRPLSELSTDSWHMYEKFGFGWRRVAEELIPDEYSRDHEEAANKVRKAAASFVRFRHSVEDSILSRSKRMRKLLDEIVWIDGLSQIAWRVIERKFCNARGHRVADEDEPAANDFASLAASRLIARDR